MRKVKIVTDSSSDIPASTQQELDISIVPLIVIVGDTSYLDSELSNDHFWDLAAGSECPHTSQPTPGSFRQAFDRAIAQDCDVLCLTVTSHHSGTYNCATTVAREYAGRVVVDDSLSVCAGLAIQVIRAARLAAQGMTMQQIRTAVDSLRKRMRFVAILNAMEALRAGGRAAKLMPIFDRLAGILKLYPLLTFQQGELKLLGVTRTRAKGLGRLKADILKLGDLEALGVAHIRQPKLAHIVADELSTSANYARDKIVIAEAGPVLSTHAGRGVIAIVGFAAS